MVSACLITYNEQEMLPYCLNFLNNMSEITEICIVDSQSTDSTLDLIADFSNKTSKVVHFIRQPFITFGKQKNKAMELSNEEWILLIDADETYTPQLNVLMKDLPKLNKFGINAIRIPTLQMVIDRKHFLNPNTYWLGLDPHIRLIKKGLAGYHGEIHEVLIDSRGRNLHTTSDPDVLETLSCNEYRNIWLKHCQILKSNNALLEKGKRWKVCGMIEASARRGLFIDEYRWLIEA